MSTVKEMKIGVRSANMTDDLQALVASFNSTSPEIEFAVTAVDDSYSLASKIVSNEIDAALLGGAAYAAEVVDDPDALIPFFQRVNEGEGLEYHSILLTQAGSEIVDLSDLQGKTIGFGSLQSTSGYLIPATELTALGYPLADGEYFGQVDYFDSHYAAIEAVQDGSVDAAFTWSPRIGDFSQGYDSGALRQFVDEGRGSASEFKEVWHSGPIPGGAFFVNSRFSDNELDDAFALLADLYSSGRHSDGFEDLFGGSVSTGLVRSNTVSYQPIIDITLNHVFGTNQVDTLTGSDDGDLIRSFDGDDVINSGGGHDHITDGLGNDTIQAGAGNDTIINLGGSDVVDGGDGIDWVITDLSQAILDRYGFDAFSFDVGLDLESGRHGRISGDIGIDQYSNIENYQLIGDFHAELAGDSGNNIIIAGGGDDKVSGRQGDDTLQAGRGSDYLLGGTGHDSLVLDADGVWGLGFYAKQVSSDDNVGTQKLVSLYGLNQFADVIDGGDGVDEILLTDTDDAFFLHDSFSALHNSLNQTADNTTVRLIDLETISAGDGDDLIDLTSEKFSLASIDMTLNGEAGNDILWAAQGDDTLNGGAGDDVLNGSAGNDILIGGSGTDIFEFTATSGNDIITDFDKDVDELHFYYRKDEAEESAVTSINNGVVTWDAVAIDLGDPSLALSDLSITYEMI